MIYKILITICMFLLLPFISYAEELDIYQKAEQMIIIGFQGSVIETSDIKNILEEGNWGGVIFFDYDAGTKKYNRNIDQKVDLKKFITIIQKYAHTPLFISIDEEGGQVSRLKSIPSFGKTYSALDMGGFSDSRFKNILLWRAKKISEFGFNMNFAPVLDICYPNTVMYKQKRCFSTNHKIVTSLAYLFGRALESQGVLPVYKHYPGIGSGTKDTHKGFVDITKTHRDVDKNVFINICEKYQYPAVMVSHIVDTSVDILPASLSKKHLDILRLGNCKDALVITDDMDMGAITNQYVLRDILEKSINASNDMIIFSNNINTYDKEKIKDIKKTLHELIDSKTITQETIETAYSRILLYKKHIGLLE